MYRLMEEKPIKKRTMDTDAQQTQSSSDPFFEAYAAADHRKRSRPTSLGASAADGNAHNDAGSSSLGYKLPSHDLLPDSYSSFLAPPRKHQLKKHQEKALKQNGGQTEQAGQSSQRFSTTRARGSGIPPRKYTPEELVHLDHVTLMQALSEDPELAAAFAKDYAKTMRQQRKEKRQMMGSMKSSRSSSSGGKSPVKPGKFLDDLKKDGVPVVQWVVVLGVVTLLVYHLYKFLAGPKALPKRGKSLDSGGATGRQQKGSGIPKKARSGGGGGKKTGKQRKIGTDDAKVDAVVAAIERVEEKNKKAVNETPVAAGKKLKRNKNKSKPSTKVTKSKDNGETPVPPSVRARPTPAPPVVVEEEIIIDEGEWQTVGKSQSKVAEPEIITPLVNGVKSGERKNGIIPTNGISSAVVTPDKEPTTSVEVEVKDPIIVTDSSANSEPELGSPEKPSNTSTTEPEEALPDTDIVDATKPDENALSVESAATKMDDAVESAKIPKEGNNGKLTESEKGSVSKENGETIENSDKKHMNGGQKSSPVESVPTSLEDDTAMALAVATDEQGKVEVVSNLTVDDAALALELQHQEEKMAKAEAAAAASREEVWEQVTVRRRRNK